MAQTRSFAVVISGRGSNMLAIAAAARTRQIPVTIAVVLADRDAPGLTAARELGLPTQQIAARDFASRDAFDAALAAAIDSSGADYVALAGFMRILGSDFVARYEGRMLNIHPSLLPRHKGLHTHRRALEAGDREHGASVHYVTADLDGGPLIAQAVVPIEPSDDEASLSARVHAVEHMLYPRVCGWVAEDRVTFCNGHVFFDGHPLSAPRMESI
jgi:phosphoribosylglycinamide formyltransferase-1